MGADKSEKKAKRKSEEDESKKAKKSKIDDHTTLPKKDKKDKKRDKKADASDDELQSADAATPTPPPPPPPAEPTSTFDGVTRVFIGNLSFQTEESTVKALFKDCGSITSVEWLNHADTGRWKGAGFLEFDSPAAAEAATKLNETDLDGRQIKVSLAHPRKEGAAFEPGEPSESVFLGNLSWTLTEEPLRDFFDGCGAINRIKWIEKDGQWTGKCIVEFDSVETATKAVAKNGEDLTGRPIRINFCKPRAPTPGGTTPNGRPQRSYKPVNPKPEGCTELFCGNLPWSIDDAKIAEFFKGAGEVVGTRWLNDRETQEFKGVGFITFNTTEEVDAAVLKAGEYLDGRQIRIDYAGKKKEASSWGGNKW